MEKCTIWTDGRDATRRVASIHPSARCSLFLSFHSRAFPGRLRASSTCLRTYRHCSISTDVRSSIDCLCVKLCIIKHHTREPESTPLIDARRDATRRTTRDADRKRGNTRRRSQFSRGHHDDEARDDGNTHDDETHRVHSSALRARRGKINGVWRVWRRRRRSASQGAYRVCDVSMRFAKSARRWGDVRARNGLVNARMIDDAMSTRDTGGIDSRDGAFARASGVFREAKDADFR